MSPQELYKFKISSVIDIYQYFEIPPPQEQQIHKKKQKPIDWKHSSYLYCNTMPLTSSAQPVGCLENWQISLNRIGHIVYNAMKVIMCSHSSQEQPNTQCIENQLF
ncbi:hypothetical protein Glove_65g14 [Diversispora epigaea]|uniref:Uncharacterized protein n=1 Tax=Diversispora epigaea TaxID=1348612 RepID=A0A397JBW2_9GLOM|nr:hypothetical protein Glove_65g14 [Diversispora epigaea]